jgi:hypothetical protein
MRSKQDGRRAWRRHLGSSAYAFPRSAPKACKDASNRAL